MITEEGVSGEALLSRFKERQEQIRLAVEAMLADAVSQAENYEKK